MKIPFFKLRRPTLEELEDRRAHRSAGLRRVIAVAGIILLGFVAFLLSMLILPSMQELQSLRHEKERYQLQLKQARLEEKQARDHYNWLDDPEYYEQVARDRVNVAKDGETVIRFQEEEKPAQPKKRD